jgi:hypothetical protein
MKVEPRVLGTRWQWRQRSHSPTVGFGRDGEVAEPPGEAADRDGGWGAGPAVDSTSEAHIDPA